MKIVKYGMSTNFVGGILPDPDESHDGIFEQFEKFKVKVYIGVRFEIV